MRVESYQLQRSSGAVVFSPSHVKRFFTLLGEIAAVNCEMQLSKPIHVTKPVQANTGLVFAASNGCTRNERLVWLGIYA